VSQADEVESLLEARGITKIYPGVVALDNVDFQVNAGEVHCLAGENGAGKSTLIEILGGSYPKDGGAIRVSGKEVEFASPRHAQERGIAVLHQELPILPHLSVAENIFLSRQPLRAGRVISYTEMNRQARRWLEMIQAEIDPRALLGDLPISRQQLVSIAKALSLEARVIIFDEPSAVLTTAELKRLFEIIGSLKAEGRGIVYISHRLEEIFEIGDRVTVLRNGKLVGTEPTARIDRGTLIKMLVGREIDESEGSGRGMDSGGASPAEAREPVLEVRRLARKGILTDINFTLHKGEILGVYGLVGAGRTELARALIGADRVDSGDILLEGRRLRIASPRDAIRSGLCLAPEDRKTQGVFLEKSVQDNICLPSLKSLKGALFVSYRRVARYAADFVSRLRIVTPSTRQLVKYLSGGNQQKVVLAKWLGMKLKVFIFDEPTRGIDVGAKEEIRGLIKGLAREGKSVIMISSEIPEILGISDRVAVMHEGRIEVILGRGEASREKLMAYSMGAKGA
jgi:ribose transport system ATP-binding protein